MKPMILHTIEVFQGNSWRVLTNFQVKAMAFQELRVLIANPRLAVYESNSRVVRRRVTAQRQVSGEALILANGLIVSFA